MKKAREILSNPECWCKKHDASDENGNFINPTSERAVKWCIIGAYQKAYNDPSCGVIYYYMDPLHSSLKEVFGKESLIAFNEDPATTHKDVLDLYDRAIEMAIRDYENPRQCNHKKENP